MKITKRTAIGVTLIVLIGLTSWGLAGTLTEQQYIDAGKAEFPKGNYETAIYLFTAGLQLNPDNPGLYNDRGLCYLKEASSKVDAYLRSDVEEAITDFDKAIELNPDFAEAYYNRGLAYYAQGSYYNTTPFTNAISDFTTAIGLLEDPDKIIDAYYNRGLAYGRFIHYYNKPFGPEIVDKYHKALVDFDKVLELDQTYVLAYTGKGDLYYRYGDFDNSTAEFTKALESEDLIIQKVGEKGLASVYYSRGRNYGKLYEYRKGALDYEKAVELDPTDPYPTLMIALGHLTGNYKRLGEWNKLIEVCDYMLELKKDDPEWLTAPHGGYTKYEDKGVAYYNLMKQMANEAISNYNKLIELKPSVSAYRGLGAVYLSLGECEKAKEAFEKALAMDNTTIEEGTYTRMYSKYHSRGLTYYEMREYDRAISDFNKSIELKSDYAEAYRDLGKAYVAIGDTANATEAFETAVSLFEEAGNSYEVGQVRQLLEELPTVVASALPTLITEYSTVPEDVCPIA
jgi:tetratricopeptide (TPR) repeat protein